MKNLIKNPKLWLIISGDISLIIFSYFFAHWLRFETIPQHFQIFFKVTLPLLVIFKISIFYFFGVYRGMWRYTGLNDLLRIVGANIVSTSVFATFLAFAYRFAIVSRGILIMDMLCCTFCICGFRILIRVYFSPEFNLRSFFQKNQDYKRLLIIGAGDAGEKLLREIRENISMANYNVIGFLDDSKGKQGLRIHNIPVLGRVEQVDSVIKAFGVDEIFIAISRISGNRMRNVVRLCAEANIPYKVVPGLGELILSGGRGIQKVRNVAFEDLLGREPVSINDNEVRRYLMNKRVMVTGAGGSIGSELCLQICRYQPGQLIMIDQGEFNLYKVESTLDDEFQSVKKTVLMRDVANIHDMEKIISMHRPEVIFHAAAYKHVPMVEINPLEGIRNNTIATCNLAVIADKYKVERFVFISTDKAVRPTNVMGATKRAAEIFIQSLSEKSVTNFMAVRFGNVVGSDGSVVPLFMKQIKKGGPVTVTDPEITRYFMSIKEAVQLVLQAGTIGDNNRIFLLDMGEPVKIVDLARDLIILNGYKPDEEIKIEFTGLRPGEKLIEELLIKGEDIEDTCHKKIKVLKPLKTDKDMIEKAVNLLQDSISSYDKKMAIETLISLVQDYTPSKEILSLINSKKPSKNAV